jgi:predicted Zn-dependent protease
VSSRIEYIPPQAHDNRVEVNSSNKEDDAGVHFITAKKTSPKSKEAIKTNAVAKTKIEKADKSISTEVSAIPEVEKIFLANANKNAEIARLVADIHWEMEHGNKKQTEKLLDELALLKGQNNSYVLKLKAVWHIHNKEFERAEDLLKIVLTKNELDQEAGINMAIIEINTKQMENAYQRLTKLQILYPENIRIAEIMQDLKLLFNKAQQYHLIKDKES